MRLLWHSKHLALPICRWDRQCICFRVVRCLANCVAFFLLLCILFLLSSFSRMSPIVGVTIVAMISICLTNYCRGPVVLNAILDALFFLENACAHTTNSFFLYLHACFFFICKPTHCHVKPCHCDGKPKRWRRWKKNSRFKSHFTECVSKRM